MYIGLPNLGLSGYHSKYAELEAQATAAARRNGAALWYVGANPDGWVYEDSTGTTPATGTDPVGLLLDRSRVAGEQYGADFATNGNFNDGLTGYSFSAVTPTVVSGEAVLDATNVFNSFRTNGVTVVPGKSYKITWRARLGTATAAKYSVQVAGGADIIASTAYAATGTMQTFTAFFTVPAACVSIYFYLLRDSGSLGTVIVDDYTIQEAIGTLGPELSLPSGSITLAAGVTIVDGALVFDGTQADNQSILITAATVLNSRYKLVYNVTRTSGDYRVRQGGGADAFVSDSGLLQKQIVAANINAFQIQSSAGAAKFVGSISFSVREVLGYPALQATSGNRPTLELQSNGYYGMRFDGSNDNFTTAIQQTASFTWIAALNRTAATGYVFGTANAAAAKGAWGDIASSANERLSSAGGVIDLVSATPRLIGTSAVMTYSSTSGAQRIYRNGTQLASGSIAGSPLLDSTTLFAIGCAGVNLPASYATGAYWLICNSPVVMSDSDRIAIERFAALLSGASYS